MENGFRRATALTALVTIGVMVSMSGIGTAHAERGQPPADAGSNGSASAGSNGHELTVTVSGNGYQGGAAGADGGKGGSGEVTVTDPSPCWMIEGRTGKDYYEFVTSGDEARMYMKSFGEYDGPRPGYEKHKADDKGHWYGATCSLGYLTDPKDRAAQSAVSDEFTKTHPAAYYPANETPPQTAVAPEVLRDIAVENLTVPEPQLDWNPKRMGNQGTLVNLDTWFWLQNHPSGTLTVRATAGGNEASVTATFGGMTISAPGEDPVSCAGSGTPYAAGARTNCSMAFSRASSRLGGVSTPVTVSARWTGTWASMGKDQGALTPPLDPVTGQAEVRVDEIQTLVTGAR